MAIGDRKDPYRGFNFRLELGTSAVAGFRECSGLSFTSDPVEYREGTDVPLHARKLPARPSLPTCHSSAALPTTKTCSSGTRP